MRGQCARTPPPGGEACVRTADRCGLRAHRGQGRPGIGPGAGPGGSRCGGLGSPARAGIARPLGVGPSAGSTTTPGPGSAPSPGLAPSARGGPPSRLASSSARRPAVPIEPCPRRRHARGRALRAPGPPPARAARGRGPAADGLGALPPALHARRVGGGPPRASRPNGWRNAHPGPRPPRGVHLPTWSLREIPHLGSRPGTHPFRGRVTPAGPSRLPAAPPGPSALEAGAVPPAPAAGRALSGSDPEGSSGPSGDAPEASEAGEEERAQGERRQ